MASHRSPCQQWPVSGHCPPRVRAAEADCVKRSLSRRLRAGQPVTLSSPAHVALGKGLPCTAGTRSPPHDEGSLVMGAAPSTWLLKATGGLQNGQARCCYFPGMTNRSDSLNI